MGCYDDEASPHNVKFLPLSASVRMLFSPLKHGKVQPENMLIERNASCSGAWSMVGARDDGSRKFLNIKTGENKT